MRLAEVKPFPQSGSRGLLAMSLELKMHVALAVDGLYGAGKAE
jgi:hypothetical protein